jgi:hypothetical protein
VAEQIPTVVEQIPTVVEQIPTVVVIPVVSKRLAVETLTVAWTILIFPTGYLPLNLDDKRVLPRKIRAGFAENSSLFEFVF